MGFFSNTSSSLDVILAYVLGATSIMRISPLFHYGLFLSAKSTLMYVNYIFDTDTHIYI